MESDDVMVNCQNLHTDPISRCPYRRGNHISVESSLPIMLGESPLRFVLVEIGLPLRKFFIVHR